MKRRGKILYLDQFAVSNMYNADAESHWGQLREAICQKLSEGKLLYPMPLEHLYETVGRSATDKDGVKSQQYLESIKAQHDFFWKLARGKVFYGYEDIAAAEIIMLLKQGKVSNIKSMYIHKAYNPQIDILDFYDEGHIINIDMHNYNTELFSGINFGMDENVECDYFLFMPPNGTLTIRTNSPFSGWKPNFLFFKSHFSFISTFFFFNAVADL